MNSAITLDKDYVIDAGIGISVTTSGTSAITPSIYNDGIIGNIDGVVINDAGSTPSTTAPVNLINNDVAFNTIGLLLENSSTSPQQAYVASNIFWENHDQTNARSGYAVYSQNVNKVTLQNNLFYGNGTSDTNQTNATNNLGNGFSPTLLGTTAAAAQSNQGNFVGNPSFVFPIDPRPGSDGPANFYIDADFETTSKSAAIDNAWEATAIATDFLGNSQVYTNGGLGIAGYRTARHRCLSSSVARVVRRSAARSASSPTRWLRSPGNYSPLEGPTASQRRPHPSPSRSRATSTRRISRRPTWYFRVQPSTRRCTRQA